MDRDLSLTHFRRGSCHCHSVQMVGRVGGAAFGIQELYWVRTSSSFELKVQSQEISGEGRAGGVPCHFTICRPISSDSQVVESSNWARVVCRFHVQKHPRTRAGMEPRGDPRDSCAELASETWPGEMF